MSSDTSPTNCCRRFGGAITDQLGAPETGKWTLKIDPTDSQTINFHYPTVLPSSDYEGMAYITPRVKLQLGARGDL